MWDRITYPSQASKMQPLKFGMDKQFHTTLYNGCHYSSTLGLKLIHVVEKGYWPSGHKLLDEITMTALGVQRSYPYI